MNKDIYKLVEVGNRIHIAVSAAKYALLEYSLCGLSDYPNDKETDMGYVVRALKGLTLDPSNPPKSSQVMCSKCLAKAMKLINRANNAKIPDFLFLTAILKTYIGIRPPADVWLDKPERNTGKVLFSDRGGKKHLEESHNYPFCGGVYKGFDCKESASLTPVAKICERCLTSFFSSLRLPPHGELNVLLWSRYEGFLKNSIIGREKFLAERVSTSHEKAKAASKSGNKRDLQIDVDDRRKVVISIMDKDSDEQVSAEILVNKGFVELWHADEDGNNGTLVMPISVAGLMNEALREARKRNLI